jgi:hypothetical protein
MHCINGRDASDNLSFTAFLQECGFVMLTSNANCISKKQARSTIQVDRACFHHLSFFLFLVIKRAIGSGSWSDIIVHLFDLPIF